MSRIRIKNEVAFFFFLNISIAILHNSHDFLDFSIKYVKLPVKKIKKYIYCLKIYS